MQPVDYIPRIRDNYARLGYKAYRRAEQGNSPSCPVCLS